MLGKEMSTVRKKIVQYVDFELLEPSDVRNFLRLVAK